MSDILHIVCLDAPAPPDYGGAIDMFYKVRALAATGKKIILHYFDYRPQRGTSELESLCEAVYRYKRKPFWKSLPLRSPFIVSSRINRELIDQLNDDDYPVLLEGLHCSGIVPFLNNSERAVVRMHNEEAAYYRFLARAETKPVRKAYFLRESELLFRYQKTFDKSVRLACLSETDIETFRGTFGFERISFVPCFIAWQEIKSLQGSGDYCLYHGNLQVSENEQAALWLIKNVFSSLTVPLVVAGKGVSQRLAKAAKPHRNIRLVNDPSIEEIGALIQQAHINVLPSLNTTGVKLKLLNALLNGRHCLVNVNGVKGSGIKNGLSVMNEPEAWRSAVTQLMAQPFSVKETDERKNILSIYDNRLNAEKLNALWTRCQ